MLTLDLFWQQNSVIQNPIKEDVVPYWPFSGCFEFRVTRSEDWVDLWLARDSPETRPRLVWVNRTPRRWLFVDKIVSGGLRPSCLRLRRVSAGGPGPMTTGRLEWCPGGKGLESMVVRAWKVRTGPDLGPTEVGNDDVTRDALPFSGTLLSYDPSHGRRSRTDPSVSLSSPTTWLIESSVPGPFHPPSFSSVIHTEVSFHKVR